MSGRPRKTIAIAGAWGYIGRKFLDAATLLGWTARVHDPGAAPGDLDPHTYERVDSERDFYERPADLFHLALHPEHRRKGVERLLARSLHEPIQVLCEKPMAEPGQPEKCRRVIAAVDQSRARFLYDFPELYDPITQRICAYLDGFREVTIDRIEVQRSKDREEIGNPRNFKRMVTIQFQESVHCLAFVLYLLAKTRGGLAHATHEPLSVTAEAQPYIPPNPSAYQQAVDGRCVYQLAIGSVAIDGLTDFKRGAEWAKRRVIQGRSDGQPFRIEADFLEGKKRLVINGQPQEDGIQTNSYVEVLRTLDRWNAGVSCEELMQGTYPHPRFAFAAYQLSSMLWRSSHDRKTLRLETLDELLE